MEFGTEGATEIVESPEEVGVIINSVIELQRKCKKYVSEQSEDFLTDLYSRGLLKVGKNPRGEIVATFYQLPLNILLSDSDQEQIFRIGGLSTQLTPDSVKVLLKMLKDLENEIITMHKKVIATSKNATIAKYLKKVGMIEVTFEEALLRYPQAVELYLSRSGKSAEEYKSNKFFVGNL